MIRAHNTRFADVMILPALIILVILFLLPLGLFVFEAMQGQKLTGLVIAAHDVLIAPEVMRAILATNVIALEVTMGALLVGYPLAFYLTRASGWRFYLVMFGVVAPTLTSTVVRTFSLMVLAGRHGILNTFFVDQLRLFRVPVQLLYNRPAVVVAMIYVLLPYMVLTLYAAMRSIDTNLLKASRSLGASERYVFLKVFFPLTLHGVISGSLMVFIFGLGYYLTPALVGGSADVMIAQLIQRTIENTLDWTSAAFMSIVLTAMTLVLFAVYSCFSNLRNLTSSEL